MKIMLLLFLVISFEGLAQNKESYLYNQAVKDAYNNKNLTKKKVLFNISSRNSSLKVRCNPRWNCAGSEKDWEKRGKFKKLVRVKMVSWVSAGTAAKFFVPRIGKIAPYNTGTGFLWVTAFPQVQNFCQGVDRSNVRLRLEQYLGLPATGRKTHFVHLWVEPKDLFRPCFDPEISDTKCDYKFSRKTSATHRQWMKDTFNSTYPAQGKKVPWTRLGYTYDWGNPKSYIGASEYVIKQNSRVYVESVTPTGIYCAK